MVTWGVYRKSPPGYSGEPSLNPYDNHSPKGGLTIPNTYIANCSQAVPDITVVCTDSLWEHTIALSNSTRP